MTIVAAGTEKGVYISQDGTAWSPSGLANQSIDTLAVPAVHVPVKFLAGSDGPLSAGNVPMFQSIDGGATWSALNPAVSGTYIVKLAAGPLPPVGDTRPVIAGTNAGLFASNDNGVSFLPLSAGGSLPATDYTQIAFITDHHDRFYAASDGGGSGSGGLWRTNDGGASFLSLVPPMPSITALAVSNDESPFLYVATFRPSDHFAVLWLYRDTGGTPQGPLGSRPRRRARAGHQPGPPQAPACWTSSRRPRRRTSGWASERWWSSCSQSSPTCAAAAGKGSRLPRVGYPSRAPAGTGLEAPAPPAAVASYVPTAHGTDRRRPRAALRCRTGLGRGWQAAHRPLS